METHGKLRNFCLLRDCIVFTDIHAEARRKPMETSVEENGMLISIYTNVHDPSRIKPRGAIETFAEENGRLADSYGATRKITEAFAKYHGVYHKELQEIIRTYPSI